MFQSWSVPPGPGAVNAGVGPPTGATLGVTCDAAIGAAPHCTPTSGNTSVWEHYTTYKVLTSPPASHCPAGSAGTSVEGTTDDHWSDC